jgi:hypothetical protein
MINRGTGIAPARNSVFQNNLNHFFDQAFGPFNTQAPVSEDPGAFTTWAPLCDIYETDKNIVIKTELPEVRKENVSVMSDNNVLLSAEIDQLLEHDGSVLSGGRAILARLEEDLSFRPGINMAMMRFLSVNTVRVRPGHDAEFREARKIINAAYEKANADQHLAVFQVTAGAPIGTYLIFRGRESLAELDAPPNQAIQQAMGESNQKKLQELASSYLLSNEANIFSIKPDMSYAPKTFAAADPAFWTPKAALATRPAAKKPPVKSGTGQ